VVLAVEAVRQPWLELVPVGVLAGGGGLADARRAVADADVAVAPTGVGELHEPAVLLGGQELRAVGGAPRRRRLGLR
jgi:hypothetical protein